MSLYNGLTPAEEERLAIFLEEAGENLQEIGKVVRHGFESRDPTKPDSLTNRQALTKEAGDMLIAIHLLMIAKDLDQAAIKQHIDQKLEKMLDWIHHPDNKTFLRMLRTNMT